MNETPILRQLLICEKLIFEAGTNSVSLINCHEGWIAEQFPAHVPLIAFGILADGFGTFTIRVEITRLDTGEVVFQQTMPMLMNDRLSGARFVYRNKFRFQVEGRYEIGLFADRELLGIATFSIRAR